MSAPARSVHWRWPPEILSLAEAEACLPYLQPLLSATRRIFTDGEVQATLETDPEIRDDHHITFQVRAPGWDAGRVKAAQDQWVDELLRLCPAGITCLFRIRIDPRE